MEPNSVMWKPHSRPPYEASWPHEAVPADDAEELTAVDLEGDVSQGAELPIFGSGERVNSTLLERIDSMRRDPERLLDAARLFNLLFMDQLWSGNRALYEKLVLDGFQAGLSWITILRKRDNFRRAFDDFEPAKIARYKEKKIHALMNDAGIVRNRAKIEGAVGSAKAYLKIMEEGPGFSKFLWDFVGGRPKVNNFKTTASVPASTPPPRAVELTHMCVMNPASTRSCR